MKVHRREAMACCHERIIVYTLLAFRLSSLPVHNAIVIRKTLFAGLYVLAII